MPNLCLWLSVENFEKKRYLTPNMPSILKVTSTVDANALKPSFGDTKHVRRKLESLSKYHTERGGKKMVQNVGKAKEKVDKGKGKVEEPQKK